MNAEYKNIPRIIESPVFNWFKVIKRLFVKRVPIPKNDPANMGNTNSA
jgi:hypothetical protein